MSGADAASGENGCGVDGLDDLWPQDEAADLAGVPATFVALRDDEVDAGCLVLEGLVRTPAQSRNQAASIVDFLDHIVRRRAEGVCDEANLVVLEGDVDLRTRRSSRPPEKFVVLFFRWQFGDAVIGEEL